MKVKMFILSMFGIICEIVTILSLPMCFGILIIKVLWFTNISIWLPLACVILFVSSAPLWWYFHAKVEKLNLENEKEN